MNSANLNALAMKDGTTCGNCAGIEGEGYDLCPIFIAMEELFGGTADDMFCPFFDIERGIDHDAEPPDFTNEELHQLTVDEVLQNGCEDG